MVDHVKDRCCSRDLVFSECQSAEKFPRVYNVASKHAKHHHAAVKRAKAFICQERAHIEKLLIVIYVNSSLNLLLSHIHADSTIHDRHRTSQIIRATLSGKGTNLLLLSFLVNDFNEEKHVWSDVIAFGIVHFEEKNQMIG